MPTMLNLTSLIKTHALSRPNRVALRYGTHDTTYEMLYRSVQRVAGLLRARGIDRGDVVAALMRNSPAFIEISLAVSHLGAIFLPINFRLAQAEVADITTDASARLLCVDSDLCDSCPLGMDLWVFSEELREDASLPDAGSSDL